MEYLILGFFTGLSLILAIGAQNIFVIEQGLKKQHVFLVSLICSISDLILIFLGIFLFHYFIQYFNSTIELIFNILLIISCCVFYRPMHEYILQQVATLLLLDLLLVCSDQDIAQTIVCLVLVRLV